MAKQKKIEEEKRKIRSEARQNRDLLSQAQIRLWSDMICENLQKQPFFKAAETIYFYYPLGSEVNLLPLAQRAMDLGKQAAFPRVNGSEMAFYQVSSLEEFAEGAFHVMEPVGDDVMDRTAALVFVPGLIFDSQGNRMGYGKGYYDRYFARYPDCRKVGICYGMQRISRVPCGEFDIPMDMVVTECGFEGSLI